MISYSIEITILSLIQGISEFLPISSSAHLILISQISNFKIASLEIDVGMHLGSLLAILFYFRKDLSGILVNKNLLKLIILGSLPLFLVGFIFYQTGFINYLRDIRIIAWTTLIFGILLFIADKFETKKSINNDLNVKNIFLIGIFQILSLVPGVSRSGITITAGRFINFNRLESSKISFYLSIPALAGASVLTLKDVFEQNYQLNIFVLISIILSFFFSYFTIKFFLIYVQKFNLNIFVYYRIFLSFLLFVIIYN
tara:strand:- start:8584 stop:9351 length:768 start_codon:yes stop_codon:yes gene_type:complete